jgi:hypothetical protein
MLFEPPRWRDFSDHPFPGVSLAFVGRQHDLVVDGVDSVHSYPFVTDNHGRIRYGMLLLSRGE